MKKRTMLLRFASLLTALSLLSACSSPKEPSPTPTPQEGETEEEEKVETPPAPPKPYTPPDYSDHTNVNEDQYETHLADLSQLQSGAPLLAIQRGPLETPSFTWKEGQWDENFYNDLRWVDASQTDLSSITDYNQITFNSATRWPETLPENFDPDAILELGKDPGLGIRSLQEEGITGKGVSIAIIDQGLYADHPEYRDNLMLYEEIHCFDDSGTMHGSAVSSLAVGQEVGVAPDANLYYIGTTFSHRLEDETTALDFSILADCVYRVLEINRQLPQEEKIRVISISRGFSTNDPGGEELLEAIRQANAEGILVLTTSTEIYYPNFPLFALSRDYLADPNDFDSYVLPAWQTSTTPKKDYMIPSGGRTYASCTGENGYEIGYSGAMSWTMPWLAGLYALCCQVKPEITPDEFRQTVRETAQVKSFGKLVDPVAIIRQLQGEEN